MSAEMMDRRMIYEKECRHNEPQCNEFAETIQNHDKMKLFGRSDVSQYYLCCKSVSNSGLARIFTQTKKYALDRSWRCNCFTGHLCHGQYFSQPYG